MDWQSIGEIAVVVLAVLGGVWRLSGQFSAVQTNVAAMRDELSKHLVDEMEQQKITSSALSAAQQDIAEIKGHLQMARKG